MPAAPIVTLSQLNAINTAACPPDGKLPAYCKQAFPGQQDLRPGVATPLFDPPTGNVSDEDMHAYIANGQQTRIFANFMMGFCTGDSGPRCHNNVRTGYNSDDNRTIAAQVEDLRRRHIDGAVVSWQGAGTKDDEATVRLQKYLNAHGCEGSQCATQYVIMYDGASLSYNVGSTGVHGTSADGCGGRRGKDYENCTVAHLRNDMCYLNGMHWGNPAYLRWNGHPVLLIFPKGGVIPNGGGAPSWADVWKHVEDWNKKLSNHCGKAPYDVDNGVPLLVFEHADGFNHQASSGAYAWVKVAGTNPEMAQFNFDVYQAHDPASLDGFYGAARQHMDKQVWGAAYKGFNSSEAAWGTGRILDQECGRLWMASVLESNKFFRDRALPFLQIVTWNDYNEGTEIETGIDNCMRVQASVSGATLSWTLVASSRLATMATVSRMEIYDSSDGERLKLLARVRPTAKGTFDLTGLSPGEHKLYVRMVGKNSILNRISAAVPYSRE
ncbi:MAG TPA: hypothetical protein VHA37_01375 [Candidatus Saccharimonadales bacterium]|nr:hypothetical protein [Candidatus Saccharimonadales bacterium]